MEWSNLFSGFIGALIGGGLSFLASVYTTNKNIRSLKAMEQERQERESEKQRETIISELIAEIEDNLQDATNVTYSESASVPMLSDMWNSHKGKLDFLVPGVRESLRCIYAQIFKLNAYASRLQNLPHDDAVKERIEKQMQDGKKKLESDLEDALTALKGL